MSTDLKIVQEIHNVVYSNPGFVYSQPGGPGTNCVYVYDDKPSCIVGHVVHNLGVSIETLKEYDDTNNIFLDVDQTPPKDAVMAAAGYCISSNFDNPSHELIQAVEKLQYYQDTSGCSWEYCLNIAIHDFPILTSDHYLASRIINMLDMNLSNTYIYDSTVNEIFPSVHQAIAVSDEMGGFIYTIKDAAIVGTSNEELRKQASGFLRADLTEETEWRS